MEDRPVDGSALTVRVGHPHDAPFVIGLGAAAFARFGDYGPIMAGFLASPAVVSFIAEEGGSPVGFALLELEGADRGIADLVAIAVDPAHRRRGVGRALMSRVVAARRKPTLLVLTVAEDNAAAIRLFRSHGFEMLPGSIGRYAGGQASRRMARPVLPPPGTAR
jgi:ribosomal-protein-alanine N-acetyltransferase